MAHDDLDSRAGKAPEDDHPVQSDAPDPGDLGDPRVAQPGEEQPGEDAMKPIPPKR